MNGPPSYLKVGGVVMHVADGGLTVEAVAVLVHLVPGVKGGQDVPGQRQFDLHLAPLVEHDINHVVVVQHRQHVAEHQHVIRHALGKPAT